MLHGNNNIWCLCWQKKHPKSYFLVLERKTNKQTKQVMYLKAERAVADGISNSDGELSSNKFGWSAFNSEGLSYLS